MGTRIPLNADQVPDVSNIMGTYFEATDEDVAAGLGWYAMAHQVATRIADGDTERGAGVIAALSPQKAWNENVAIAERAFAEGHASKQVSDACNKADHILWGSHSPLDILGGNKVRNFYRAIMGDEDAVVIDRHAFDVALGRIGDDASRRILSRVGVYDTFAQAYRIAAQRLSDAFGETILPSQVQAVTWLAWRRSKGIVD